MAIMAQRLVRKNCPKCQQPYKPDPGELQSLDVTAEQAATGIFMRGSGCSHCQQTGYRGRTAVYELLVMNGTMREMTFRSEPAQNLRRQARLFGMKTLVEDAVDRALTGVTNLQEVFKLHQGGH
jgi:type IV pilus assembly protein PilB